MQAKDIMRKRVITAKPEMTLKELAQLFTERHISGAPVVDGKGKERRDTRHLSRHCLCPKRNPWKESLDHFPGKEDGSLDLTDLCLLQVKVDGLAFDERLIADANRRDLAGLDEVEDEVDMLLLSSEQGSKLLRSQHPAVCRRRRRHAGACLPI